MYCGFEKLDKYLIENKAKKEISFDEYVENANERIEKTKKYLSEKNKKEETPSNKKNQEINKEITSLLNKKNQIILYGPAGTGKTFSVKDIIEEHSKKNEDYKTLKKGKRVEFITFHQSFAYEEFIEGIKPDLNNEENEVKYEIKNGIFKELCEKAILETIKNDEDFMRIENTKLQKFEKLIFQLREKYHEEVNLKIKLYRGRYKEIQKFTEKNIYIKNESSQEGHLG